MFCESQCVAHLHLNLGPNSLREALDHSQHYPLPRNIVWLYQCLERTVGPPMVHYYKEASSCMSSFPLGAPDLEGVSRHMGKRVRSDMTGKLEVTLKDTRHRLLNVVHIFTRTLYHHMHFCVDTAQRQPVGQAVSYPEDLPKNIVNDGLSLSLDTPFWARVMQDLDKNLEQTVSQMLGKELMWRKGFTDYTLWASILTDLDIAYNKIEPAPSRYQEYASSRK
ncbi:hypothetical protein F5Y17DRAFT_423190 [Xylariaceae sp. FL0594]|nr:hypothetical protein F5Y17DRAFT_423190 [Xylariaceae sp. FL0594]